MDHAHLEIASGIRNIVLATVDLVGVAHDTTVWFGMSAATVMVMILVIRMTYKSYSISARSAQVHIIQNIYHAAALQYFPLG